jgi:hypothetical protein
MDGSGNFNNNASNVKQLRHIFSGLRCTVCDSLAAKSILELFGAFWSFLELFEVFPCIDLWHCYFHLNFVSPDH